MDIDLAATITDKYMQEHPAITDTQIYVVEKQEHLYGKENTIEKIGAFKGTYHPNSGRAAFISSNIRDETDLKRTLNHELVGHFGINTFTKEAKLALLNRIVESKSEPSLRFLWNRASTDYKNSSELVQAEEIFASVAETVTNNKEKAKEAIPSIQDAVINKDRLLTKRDLENITELVDTGLRDNSRKIKFIPESDHAQFSKETTSIKQAAQTLNLSPKDMQVVLDRIQENIGSQPVNSQAKDPPLQR